MTETCKDCKYRGICEEQEYELECADREECEHYNAYLEGEETGWLME